MTAIRTLATGTHGRYIVDGARGDALLVVGFHGYAENAELMLERLRATAGAGRCLLAIEALHHFYRGRSQDVVASWMTSRDRDLMIADNVAYVDAVIDAERGRSASAAPLVYAGFSQGASMAFRAACLGAHTAQCVVSLGGDVPPDLTADHLRRVSAVLLGRNEADSWYTADRHEHDRERLAATGVQVTALTVSGGHEWTDEFSRVAGKFLQTLR